MAELRIKEAGKAESGVIVVNAPWKFDEDLAALLPALAKRLGIGEGQGARAAVMRGAEDRG